MLLIFNKVAFSSVSSSCQMGPLHDPVPLLEKYGATFTDAMKIAQFSRSVETENRCILKNLERLNNIFYI